MEPVLEMTHVDARPDRVTQTYIQKFLHLLRSARGCKMGQSARIIPELYRFREGAS